MKRILFLTTSILLCLGLNCAAVKSYLNSIGATDLETTESPQFSPNEIDRIVTLVQKDRHKSERLIEDKFIQALISKGYQLPTRSDIDKVMQEINFQSSGITNSDAAQFGKLMNVPAVLIIAVTQYERYSTSNARRLKASVSARMIRVEDGQILWIGTGSNTTSDVDLGGDLLSRISGDVSSAIPSRNYQAADGLSDK